MSSRATRFNTAALSLAALVCFWYSEWVRARPVWSLRICLTSRELSAKDGDGGVLGMLAVIASQYMVYWSVWVTVERWVCCLTHLSHHCWRTATGLGGGRIGCCLIGLRGRRVVRAALQSATGLSRTASSFRTSVRHIVMILLSLMRLGL